ncbi:PAS domain-containing protein [Roseococcus sp. YIM B11640]|uniref:PAS domain-containing protein n=1 Tax=Roseococcus sp. YIM B11640 TaxID=3133973 RepID=UPI003C7CB076
MPLALRVFLGLLLALIPAGIVQIQLEREARQERRDQLGEQAMRLAGLLAREQVSTIEAARQLLSAVAAAEIIRANQPSTECDAFLERIIAANPRYVTANLFAPSGDNICSAQPALIRTANVGNRPYLSAVLRENDFQVGQYAVGRGTGEQTLHFAAPLRDAANQPVGVVVVGLSVEWLNENLRSVAMPAGGVSVIVDRAGVVLARSSDPERYIGQPLAGEATELPRRTEPGVVELSGRDGVRRIVAYVPVAPQAKGLFVAVGLDAERYMGAAVHADRRSAIMIVGSLLLTFCLAVLGFHAAIERPVRKLLGAAQRWAMQDWTVRVGTVGGGREFGRLAAAFDSMAEAVQAREAARLRAIARMQAVVSLAPQVVLTADAQGHVDWVNEYWTALTGLSDSESRGAGWLAAVHPDDRDGAGEAWRAALAAGLRGESAEFSKEIRLRRESDDSWRWFLLNGAAIHDGAGNTIAWTAVGVDYQERRKAQEAFAATTAQLRATYESAPVGLCLLDRDFRFLAANQMLAQLTGRDAAAYIGQPLAQVLPHLAAELEPAMRRVLETGEPIQEYELRVRGADDDRYWLCSFHPVRGDRGRITGVSGAVIDITARKGIEATERLLSREVDHRAQNALSVVRGLVRLSAADARDDVPALVEVLEGRIGAMSRAHNVLSREKWVGADLGEIVGQELAAHAGRVEAEGPSLRLVPEAAQPLTLVLHELITNAVKYGALSQPGGRVAVRWENAADGFLLHWIERGGPPVSGPPGRTGFGSMLIDANIRGQLAGTIERHWDPEGLRCAITLGADTLAGGRRPDQPAEGAPLIGRRVLLAEGDPIMSISLGAALREAGCEVEGPAATVEAALALVEKAGRLDAAVLAGTLQGRSVQPVAQLLQRRAATILYLSPLGVPPDAREAHVLEAPVTPRGLREALVRLLLTADQET